MEPIKNISRKTRTYRSLHKKAGIVLLCAVFISASTGLLLGWKKNSMGYLQAASVNGKSSNPADWLPMDSLVKLAGTGLKASAGKELDLTLDRIDVRPDKGIVKFIYLRHFRSVQLDLTTGQVVKLEIRRSDWIEKLHDGSVFDYYLGLSASPIKLIYTSGVAIGLLFLCFTGFWLWFNPKRIKKAKGPNP